MSWRRCTWTTLLAMVFSTATGCSAQRRAALVPRLVVQLRAADRRAQREQGHEVQLQRGVWDVALHAELRWRAEPLRSQPPVSWP